MDRGWDGGLGGGQGDPALLAVLRGEVELHFRAWGVVGGDEAGAQAGGGDPPQSPASFSSKVSPLVAFSAVLEAYIHGKEREKMCQFPTT